VDAATRPAAVPAAQLFPTKRQRAGVRRCLGCQPRPDRRGHRCQSSPARPFRVPREQSAQPVPGFPARWASWRVAPTGAGQRIAGAADTRPKSVPPAASGRGQAPPDPPARQGRPTDAEGCGGASTIAGGAVGSERPGLKPRAQSASPLKGAVRRTGAWVDRLGAGAVGISRLQPAWGLSPAVHGRAIVETGARLIGAACRAGRVGHDRLPRRPARRARRRLAPTRWDDPSPIGDRGITVMRDPPSGRGQALPDPPARQGRPSPRVGRMTTVRGALPPPGRVTARCRAGAQRARQRVAPTRKGAAPAGACGRSPGQPTIPVR
jgi:hypothetical protein